MRGIRRTAASVAVAALLLTACSGTPAVTPSTEATTEPTESASPTEPATPTETASEVLPANDVEDPLEALQAIWDYYDYLAANPDPASVDLIFHEECECHESTLRLLERLRSQGGRVELDGERVISQIEERNRTQSTFEVGYRLDMPNARILDGKGEVVAEEDPEPRDEVAVLLRVGNRWVVRALL